MEKILVLEDEGIIALSIKDTISESLPTAQVILCSNLAAVEKTLADNYFDLAVLDVNIFGKQEGLDAGALIREISPSTQIVFLTAYSSSDVLTSIADLAPEAYLLKPFSPIQLSSVVQQILMTAKKPKKIARLDYEKVEKDNKPKIQLFQDALDKLFIVAIFSGDGTIVYCNAQFRKLWSSDQSSELGIVETVEHCFGDEGSYNSVVNLVNEGGIWEGELKKTVSNDKGERWSHNYILGLETGELVNDKFYLMLGHDITRMKKSEKNLQNLIHSRTEDLRVSHRYLASVSKDSSLIGYNSILIHELKRPLVSMEMQLSLMLKEYGEFIPPKLNSSLRQVREIIGGTSNLINHLGSLFRRKSVIQFEIYSIEKILLSVVKLAQMIFHYSGIEFQMNCSNANENFKTLPEVVFVAVFNLVKNAAEAFDSSQETKIIQISVSQSSDCIVIDICDNKIGGIPENIRSNVLGGDFNSEKNGGSGLGIAITQSILKSIGASLVLLSTGPDGSRFRITLESIREPSENSSGDFQV